MIIVEKLLLELELIELELLHVRTLLWSHGAHTCSPMGQVSRRDCNVTGACQPPPRTFCLAWFFAQSPLPPSQTAAAKVLQCVLYVTSTFLNSLEWIHRWGLESPRQGCSTVRAHSSSRMALRIYTFYRRRRYFCLTHQEFYPQAGHCDSAKTQRGQRGQVLSLLANHWTYLSVVK